MKILKKSISVIISLVMILSTMSAAFCSMTAQAYSVNYPSRAVSDADLGRKSTYNTNSSKLLTVLNKLDGILSSNDFTEFAGLDTPLDDMIAGLLADNLYNDEVITKIVTMLYPTVCNTIDEGVKEGTSDVTVLGDISDYAVGIVQDAVAMYDMYIYPKDLASQLSGIDSSKYSAVISRLNSAGYDWDNVNLSGVSWGVTNRSSFIYAMGDALCGLKTALSAMLQNKSYSGDHDLDDIVVADLCCELNISANNGYAQSILPLLETICGNSSEHVSYLSASSYNSLSSSRDMIWWLLNPLFSMIEDVIAKTPAAVVAEILPQLTYALKNNLLISWLSSLKTSIHYNVYGSTLFGSVTFDITDDTVDINLYDLLKGNLFEESDIKSINGLLTFVCDYLGLDITLPTIDDTYLSSLGNSSSFSSSGKTRIVADKSAVLLYLLRYIGAACGSATFRNQLMNIIGGYSETVDTLLVRLNTNCDEAICAIAELCTPVKYNMDAIYTTQAMNSVEIKDVAYSDYWTYTDAAKIANNLDGFINEIFGMLDMEPVGELIKSAIGGALYTNSNLNSIVIKLRSLLSDMDTVLDLLGIDISQWNAVTEDYNWGFTDGDKSGFINATVSALTPFAPLLKWLLLNQNLSLFNGQITVYGYEGYKYGVLPVLEAIGCRSEDIVTASQYSSDAGNYGVSAIIKDLLVPVVNLLERLYSEPVDTIFDILPNILYFMHSGMLETAVSNALEAAFVVIDNVRPLLGIEFDLDLSFDGIVDMLTGSLSDSDSFVSDIINQVDLLSLLSGYLERYTSKNGNTAYAVSSDSADMLTILLRTVIGIIFSGNNEKAVELTVMRSAGISSDNKKLISAVFDALNMIYEEENGTDKVLSIFMYVYLVADDIFAGDFSVVGDLVNRWEYVSSYLSSSEHDYVLRFAQAVVAALTENTVDITNTQSVNSDGAYYLSTTLGVNNVTAGTDFTDGSMPAYVNTYTTEYAATYQQPDSAGAQLYIDLSENNITDIADSGMHFSVCINAYNGNAVNTQLRAMSANAVNAAGLPDSLTITSAKGKPFTYNLNNSGNVLSSVPTGTGVNAVAVRNLSGPVPDVGDSVAMRIGQSTAVTGTDGIAYVNYSYINLSIYTVDKTALKAAVAEYVASGSAYSSDTFTAYETALSTAENVVKNAAASQTEIDAACTALISATDALSFNAAIKSALASLAAAYDSQNAVNKTNYTNVSGALEAVENAFGEYGVIRSRLSNLDSDIYYKAQTEYTAYINTKGYDTFEQGSVSYPVRTAMTNDAARTASEKYRTDSLSFETALNKVDKILTSKDFSQLIGTDIDLGKLLHESVSGILYNDEFINSVVKALYPTVCKIVVDTVHSSTEFDIAGTTVDLSSMVDGIAESMLSEYGLCLFPKDLADKLAHKDSSLYANIIAQLRGAENDWSKINWNSMAWNVSDMDSWIQALGDALSGVEPVVMALLTDADYSHAQTVYSLLSLANIDLSLAADSCSAYDKVFLPLLETVCADNVSYTYKGVEYTSLLTSQQYNSLTDSSDLFAHILYPLFTTLENGLSASPIRTVMKLIPNLALCLEYGITKNSLKALVTTVKFGIDIDIYGSVLDTEMELDLYKLITDALGINPDLSSFSGLVNSIEALGMTLPQDDTSLLGTLGTLEKKTSGTSLEDAYVLKTDDGAVFLTVMRYLCSSGVLDSLLGKLGIGSTDENDIINQLIGSLNTNSELVMAALAELCMPKLYKAKSIYQNALPVSSVKYSEFYTQDYAKVIDANIDDFVSEICGLVGADSIGTILENYLSYGIYTNKNLTDIVMKLNSVIDSVDSDGKLRALLNINTSDWNGIVEGYNWGFADGDKNGFIDALAAAFEPLFPILRFMLANADYYLFDYSIFAEGYAGYMNGIIPILEALGCAQSDILTSSAFSSSISDDKANMIKNIAVPVLNLLDRIYADPIGTILEILPNIVYFIKSGALDNALDNTLQAVYALLDTVRPIYDVELDINVCDTIDSYICNLVNGLINDYGLELQNNFKLDMFLSGKNVSRSSVSGESTRQYLMQTRADTLTLVLRFAVNFIFYSNNPEVIKQLLCANESLSENTRQLIVKVIDSLNNVYESSNGTEKVLGILYYVYEIADDYFDGGLSDDVEGKWNLISEVLSKSDKVFVVNFILSIYPELAKVIEDGGTDMPDIPIKDIGFLQKIINFFTELFEKIKSLFLP